MGRFHDSQPHEATFNGKHNMAKSKVLIVLLARYKQGLGGLSARELHNATGVSLTVLKTKLSQWAKWKYVVRRVASGYRPHYSYTISERGAKFILIRIPADRYNEYVAEINAFKNKLSKL